VKRILQALALLALLDLTLPAQTVKDRSLHFSKTSAIHVPPQDAPAGLKKIYSNLGKSKTDLYNDLDAWVVSGPKSYPGYSFFQALPFSPKSNSHVSQVQVAIGYLTGSGSTQVNLSIYGDANGVPGTLLAGPVTVTDVPPGQCCALTVANFTPLAVTAGSQYWVVADTPLAGTGSDFYGVWFWVIAPVIPVASNFDDAGWFSHNGDGRPAGEVLGTIP
jgi:hypothetical protein